LVPNDPAERGPIDDNPRWRAAKAFIAKADRAQTRADDLYISAGRHLIALKAEHDDCGGTFDEWEVLLKEQVGIGKSRASELMQIADGTKTVEGVREATAKKVRQIRARKFSPVRTGENADEDRGEPFPTRLLVPGPDGKNRLATTESSAPKSDDKGLVLTLLRAALEAAERDCDLGLVTLE